MNTPTPTPNTAVTTPHTHAPGEGGGPSPTKSPGVPPRLQAMLREAIIAAAEHDCISTGPDGRQQRQRDMADAADSLRALFKVLVADEYPKAFGVPLPESMPSPGALPVRTVFVTAAEAANVARRVAYAAIEGVACAARRDAEAIYAAAYTAAKAKYDGAKKEQKP